MAEVADRYGSFAELSVGEVEGRDYRVQVLGRPGSAVLFVYVQPC
jgi:hypothetical protein